jgi:hypothetical protein
VQIREGLHFDCPWELTAVTARGCAPGRRGGGRADIARRTDRGAVAAGPRPGGQAAREIAKVVAPDAAVMDQVAAVTRVAADAQALDQDGTEARVHLPALVQVIFACLGPVEPPADEHGRSVSECARRAQRRKAR